MVYNNKLYDLLGVKSDATSSEIKKAYHKKALDCHPDKETDPEKKEQKEKIFKTISEAYGVLSDERKRQIYDQTGTTNDEQHVNAADIFAGAGGFGFANLFGGGMSFGYPFEGIFQHHTTSQQQPPVTKLVNVNLKEIYCGESKLVEVDLQVKCTDCKGKGCANPEKDIDKCGHCGGKGVCIEIRRMGPLTTQSNQVCPKCKGQGEKIQEAAKCQKCMGNKTIIKTKKFKVTFDSDTQDGTKIVYAQKGNQNPNHDVCGDLIFMIRVLQDERFKREGDNLVSFVDISLETVLLSDKITFEHLDGRQLELSWDDLDPNKFYTVKGKGIKGKNGKSGDLIIKFTVQYPKMTLDQKTRLQSVFSWRTPDSSNYDVEKHKLKELSSV